jgi:hypothetical protein
MWFKDWYENRLSMWITVRGSGGFDCKYAQHAERNPWGPFSFVYPRAWCARY